MQSISLYSDEGCKSDSRHSPQWARSVESASEMVSTRAQSCRSLYLVMSISLIAIVACGFGPTLDKALLHAPSPRPWILYLHIVLFTGWILLFAAQASLIRLRQVMWHRRLGTVAALVGAAMPVVGIAAAIAMKDLHASEGHTVPATSLVVPFFDMLTFTVSLGLAILWRRRADFHRRLILIATCGITAAAFARFPNWLIPNDCFYFGVDGLILIAIAWEWPVTQRVHPVYRYGLPALVTGQSVTMWIFRFL